MPPPAMPTLGDDAASAALLQRQPGETMDAYEARLSALAAVRGLPALPELQWSECPAVASCYRCNLPRLHLQMGALGLHPAWTTSTCSRRCLRLLESHQLAPGLLLQTMMTLRQGFDVYKAGIDGM